MRRLLEFNARICNEMILTYIDVKLFNVIIHNNFTSVGTLPRIGTPKYRGIFSGERLVDRRDSEVGRSQVGSSVPCSIFV